MLPSLAGAKLPSCILVIFLCQVTDSYVEIQCSDVECIIRVSSTPTVRTFDNFSRISGSLLLLCIIKVIVR